MTPNERDRSRHDLERFHDGDLDAEQAEALREALFHDPSLRQRLAAVRQLDATIADSLSNAPPARRARTPVYRRASLAAALILIVGAIAAYVATSARRDDSSGGAPLAGASKDASRAAYDPIRVVLSVPVRGSRKPVEAIEPPPAEIAPSADNVLALADEHDRGATYAQVARSLRSARDAEALLDELSPSEQLIASRVWAASRTQPAVVFARLRELSHRPELAGDVRSAIDAMAGDAQLRTWLRGYRLIGRDGNARIETERPALTTDES